MTSLAEEETKATAAMSSPLHLLRPDDTHTSLVCIPEAMAALRAIKGPVKVCSLVGTQRQGKSSLLNLLHKRSCIPPGFGIGHYMDPKTHGLHFWSKPHPRQSNVTILYLDTEGLDAPHVDQFYNWTLSAVSLLISDVYMYQSKGSIDTGSIDRLAMILRVAEQLRGEASQGIRGRGKDHGDNGKSEWQKSGATSDTGASFLWLLRDHQLNMKYSPRDEMIEKLDTDALRTVRRCFDDYDCVPLPVPVDGGSKELQNMEKKVLQDLATEFREEFIVLERRLLDKLKSPRILAGQEVTGPMLADLLEAYTASVRKKDGAMADIAALPTQREMLVSLAGDRAVKAGVQHYKDAMRKVEGTVMGHKALMGLHTQRLDESIKIFHDIASNVLDSDEVGKFRHTMVEKIVGWKATMSTERVIADSTMGTTKDVLLQRSSLQDACVFGPLWSSNQNMLRKRCEETLHEIYQPLSDTLNKRLGTTTSENVLEEDDTSAHNDTSMKSEKPLPSLSKFMAALSKVRMKYSKHPFVMETSLSMSTSILSEFERDVLTPDTMRLMQGIFDAKTNQLVATLEIDLKKQMMEGLQAQRNDITTLREENIVQKNEMMQSINTKTTALEEQMTARMDTAGRSVLEERGARERSVAEQERRITTMSAEQDRLRTRIDEESKDIQQKTKELTTNLETKVREAAEQREQEASAMAEKKEAAIRQELNSLNQTLSERLDECRQSLISLNTEMEQKMIKAIDVEATMRKESMQQGTTAIGTLRTEMQTQQVDNAATLKSLADKYITREETNLTLATVSKSVADLKEFVRKEFADHSEGMTMTHTKVEKLETKMRDEHATSLVAMREEVTTLRATQETHAKTTSDLTRAVKNTIEKTKKSTEERIILMETSLKEKINSGDVLKMQEDTSQKIKSDMTALLSQKSDAANMTSLEEKFVSEVATVMQTSNDRATEMDVHLKIFRASLTDEIAQALSQCNARVNAAEVETKLATERVEASAATQEQVKKLASDLAERLAAVSGRIDEVQSNEKTITMKEVEDSCMKLREEMIRRDELLESQLVDAHAQMQRDAQAIVAPTKSQVENMRQQVGSAGPLVDYD